MAEQSYGPSFALGESARWSQLEVLRRLLEKGYPVDATIPLNNVTPLMLASSPKIASLLISHGANINARDNFGNTPLIWFLKLQYRKKSALSYIRRLIELGADITAVSNNCTSVTDLAKRKYDIDIVAFKSEVQSKKALP